MIKDEFLARKELNFISAYVVESAPMFIDYNYEWSIEIKVVCTENCNLSMSPPNLQDTYNL